MEDEEPKQISLPLFFLPKILFMLAVLASIFIFSSCRPQSSFDIRGTWDYTMTDESGNQYDIGTITFDGSDTKGTYTQINIYNVEYVGNYTVSGIEIKLTGYENWQANLNSTTMMSGTWQHDNGAQGTFEAGKR